MESIESMEEFPEKDAEFLEVSVTNSAGIEKFIKILQRIGERVQRVRIVNENALVLPAIKQYCKNLKRIELLQGEGSTSLQEFKNLTEMKLPYVRIATHMLVKCLENNPDLESFEYDYDWYNEGLTDLLKLVPKLNCLRLQLSNWKAPYPIADKLLLHSIMSSTVLTKLSIQWENNRNNLLQNMSEVVNLVELDVTMTLNAKTYPIIGLFKNLEVLSLTHAGRVKHTLPKSVKLVVMPPKLKYLQLSCVSIPTDEIYWIVEKFQILEELHIGLAKAKNHPWLYNESQTVEMSKRLNVRPDSRPLKIFFSDPNSPTHVRRLGNLEMKNKCRTNSKDEEPLRIEIGFENIVKREYEHVLPTSRRQSIVSNHISSRPPLRTSEVHILDDDFHKKQEDETRLFAETSLKSERKVTPVNTMQLILDSSIVCKKSYPDIVKEKYNLKISQRHRKISQQEERVNQLSSKRLKHCSSYENLAPAWRTPDVVVFDEDIEEKINDFPELTDSQKKIIRDAMNESYIKVLNFQYKITITRHQIETLQWDPLAWLDDDVINFYMGLLQERGEGEGYPKVFAMNTFFTTSLFSRGYSSVRRWTKNVDIFACELILVPIHVDKVHWCMAIINLVEKTIKYYDSMGSPNNRVLDELESYLKQESLAKKNIEFDWSVWNKFNVTDNPRQENGNDCGVFSCTTAEFICRNRPVIFSQQHMIYFRQKMILEICTGQLLL